jgi:hypothetical protein
LNGHSDARSTRLRTAASLLALLVPLVVYVLTLARDITFVDSGELTAVAATLGIAHPPGYPLFTLLGHLMSLLPIGSIPFRVGLLSALTTSLAALLLYRSASTIAGCVAPRANAMAREVAPLAGALLFAFALTPWSQATVVEVYGLQVCLVMAFLAATTAALREPRDAVRYWPLVAMAATAALTNHLSGGLLLAGAIVFIPIGLVSRGSGSDRPPIPWRRSLLAAAAPLLLYVYLPIRGAAPGPVSWDYPTTWHRFLVHISARQYQGILGSQGLRMSELERFLGQQMPQEAGWALPVLAAIGLLALLWGGRRFLVVTLAPLLAYLLYNMAYPIPDINLYYSPVIAILALWAAVGTAMIAHGATAAVQALARRRASSPAGPPDPEARALDPRPASPRLAATVPALVVAVVACLLCVHPLRAHWRTNDQHRFELLGRLVRDTLKYLDPNAVLFTGNWDALSSPALYYQNVTGVRPDVLVLDFSSLSSAVLQRRLARVAPDLEAACRAELEAVAEIARLAEAGRPYDIPEGRFRFMKLRRKLVEQSVALRAAYMAGDLVGHPAFEGFEKHTEGLVARLATDGEFRGFPFPEFEGPGLTSRDVRNRKEYDVWFEYGRQLANRTRYLERHGRQMEASTLGEITRTYNR